MSGDTEELWAECAKRFFKAELRRADVTYDNLADRLSKMGLSETKASIANKVSRGTFSAFVLRRPASLDGPALRAALPAFWRAGLMMTAPVSSSRLRDAA